MGSYVWNFWWIRYAVLWTRIKEIIKFLVIINAVRKTIPQKLIYNKNRLFDCCSCILPQNITKNSVNIDELLYPSDKCVCKKDTTHETSDLRMWLETTSWCKLASFRLYLNMANVIEQDVNASQRHTKRRLFRTVRKANEDIKNHIRVYAS